MELPLIVRKSKWSVMVSFIGAVVAACFFFFWHPDLWSEPLAFGLAYVFCLIATGCLGILMNGKPELVITIEGIHALHWGAPEILWEELDDVFVKSSSDGGDYLCLSLRRPEEYLARGGRLARIANFANREAGFGDLTIKPAAVGLDANELLQFVRQQIARVRSRPKRPPSAVKYHAG